MAFTLMTWSSRTAYCSREKPSFFHGNMTRSLFLFFFFLNTVQFHFEKQTPEVKCNCIGCQNMRRFEMGNRNIDNVLIHSYYCFDNVSSRHIVIFQGDYVKHNTFLIMVRTHEPLRYTLKQSNTTCPFNVSAAS